MNKETVRIENPKGLGLAGLLVLPEPGPAPLVVVAHGRGSHKGSPRNVRLAEQLAARGFGYLLFDFTGHGDSEGEPDAVAFEDLVGDLRAAVDFAYHTEGAGSLGVAAAEAAAAAALAEAAEDPRVQCLVLRAPSGDLHAVDASYVGAPTLLIQGARDPDEAKRRNESIAGQLAAEHRVLTLDAAGPRFKENEAFDVALAESVAWFERHLAE